MKNVAAIHHVTTGGNLDTSKAVRMRIDEDGMNVVMSLLSNLYSNGNEAVVREYANNARDSHVEAKQTRPIEVTLPTVMNPQFVVQDWGVGLSRDEIFNVYAHYGASTKRNSNEQIGAFGIGAKSAFTVGTQFTVTGVKDGEKTIVMFFRQREGAPMVQELFHDLTDEPDGVTVDVGVENVQAVLDAARRIFACWKSGTVLVDGEQPKSLWDNAEKLADEVYVDWGSEGYPHFKLIMGGVPYNIPNALWNEISPKAREFYQQTQRTKVTYILDVPIGRVDITPNREELHITGRTRSTVGRLVELAANSLPAWITNKLDAADTIWEAAEIYRNLISKLNYASDSSQVYWKGQSLGADIVAINTTTFSLVRGYSYDGSRTHRTVINSSWGTSITTTNYSNALFVVNVPDDKLNTVRTYAKLMLLEQNKNVLVTLSDGGYRQGWFSVGNNADHDEIACMEFADYWTKAKALRKAKTSSGSLRSKTLYSTFASGDISSRRRTVSDIKDLDNQKVYVSHHFVPSAANPVHEKCLKDRDAIFVKLNSRQSLDVFKRSFPQAEDGWTAMEAYAKEIVANLIQADIDLFKAQAAGEIDASTSTVLNFITKHRSSITNAAVLKHTDALLKNKTMADKDKTRLEFLTQAYAIIGQKNPHQGNSDSGKFFRENLPLMLVALRNSWAAEQILGTNKALVAGVIDYINSTTVGTV